MMFVMMDSFDRGHQISVKINLQICVQVALTVDVEDGRLGMVRLPYYFTMIFCRILLFINKVERKRPPPKRGEKCMI